MFQELCRFKVSEEAHTSRAQQIAAIRLSGKSMCMKCHNEKIAILWYVWLSAYDLNEFLLSVFEYYLYKIPLPPGNNPIGVNKYYYYYLLTYSMVQSPS